MNLFIYFWLCGSSLLLGLFSSCGEWGPLSSCGTRGSHCGGLSCCGTLALGHMGFSSCGTWHNSHSSWALEHSLSSRDPWTYLLCSVWDPPGSGMEPVSPALEYRFFITEPPRKLCTWNTFPYLILINLYTVYFPVPKMGCAICRALWKMKMWDPLFKKY